MQKALQTLEIGPIHASFERLKSWFEKQLFCPMTYAKITTQKMSGDMGLIVGFGKVFTQ